MFNNSGLYTWRVAIGSHSPILKPSLGQAQLIREVTTAMALRPRPNIHSRFQRRKVRSKS